MNNKEKKTNILFRLIKMLFKEFPKMLTVAIVAILVNSFTRTAPSIFMQRGIAIVEKYWRDGNWTQAKPEIMNLLFAVLVIVVIGLIANIVYTQLMAVITQGFMEKLRNKMFQSMEKLPIRFFDTNHHGDIMSYYTNDIDTLRMLISQTLPEVLFSGVMILALVGIMMWYSFVLFAIVLAGVILMLFVSKYVGGNSSKYFRKQQEALGDAEGYIEEFMNGQKVVKVFNHEKQALEGFDKVNDYLFEQARSANTYANILFPIIGNIGNILYVIVAIVGGALIINDVTNLSISGAAFGISIVVPFLNMTKQFTGNIGALSSQINSVAMAMAGASRIFDLIDQEPEIDEGKVTLVKAVQHGDTLEEVDYHSGVWAWKIPNVDGSFKLVKLEGEVIFKDVDFGYNPNKPVLKNINLYAKSGQKVAFVGATGAGKTTITNLINRFYEIQKGQITYDGIDIKDIKKDDLRSSIGLVLQETNLFTGTIMENIRYGNLHATDDEVISAARLAGAHEFIERLPDEYQTVISGSNDSLSQGQRQLISIARAIIADSPVMVLDEATSSIDTRTEVVVQKGMDALMQGRTVFVIAHRLSTVRNSDVIMVLEHGEIIERGSHEALLEQKGEYYQLYTGAFELE